MIHGKTDWCGRHIRTCGTFRFSCLWSKFPTLPGHGDTGAGLWRKSHTRINFWRYEFENCSAWASTNISDQISVLPVSCIAKISCYLLSYEPRHVHCISLSHLGPIYFVTRNCPKQSTFCQAALAFRQKQLKDAGQSKAVAKGWAGCGFACRIQRL